MGSECTFEKRKTLTYSGARDTMQLQGEDKSFAMTGGEPKEHENQEGKIMNLMRLILSSALAGVLVLAAGGALKADPDPCLVVYPDNPCTYHYDPAEYYTVGPGDPLYDPMYDRGGEVLLTAGTNVIDLSIYQALHLTGFEPTYDGNEGYFFAGTEFTLILDGFSHQPTMYVNILVQFDEVVPSGCVPQICVDGVWLSGMIFNAGDLVVSTPTPYGNNYSDVKTFEVSWRGCYGVHIWAFSDENHNGEKDDGECFTAFSHDLMIPVHGSTWGALRSLFE